MPRRLSHPIDVPVVTNVGQWLLWLGHAPAKSTGQENALKYLIESGPLDLFESER